MSEKNLEENSEKNRNEIEIAKYLFGSQRDFIVIGLCGKTGSGSSTVADILTRNFDELRLPNPNSGGPDLYREHEEKILYTFAEKNWRKFYKIKTSSLLMAHILEGDENDFRIFLDDYVEGEMENEIVEDFKRFREKEQTFSLNKWREINSSVAQNRG